MKTKPQQGSKLAVLIALLFVSAAIAADDQIIKALTPKQIVEVVGGFSINHNAMHMSHHIIVVRANLRTLSETEKKWVRAEILKMLVETGIVDLDFTNTFPSNRNVVGGLPRNQAKLAEEASLAKKTSYQRQLQKLMAVIGITSDQIRAIKKD